MAWWGRHQRWWWLAVILISLTWLGYDLGRMVTRADLVTLGGPVEGALTLDALTKRAADGGGGRLIITSPNSARFLDRSGGAWEIPGFGDKISQEQLRSLRQARVLIDGDVDISLQPVKTSPQDLILATAMDLVFKVGIIAFYAFVIWLLLSQLNRRGKRYHKIGSDNRPDTRIADVAGHEGPKQEVLEFVDYLKAPERFERAGARPPRGILLYGPPGTGKTLLAKAIAGEAAASFLEQPASSFVQIYAGEGARSVRRLFEEARKHRPCVIFIDEIDAIGGNREAMGSHDERVQCLNALLSEMDGFADNTGIVVIAATNRMETLDDALIRSGRFDRKVHVPLPSRSDREAILAVHARRLPHVTADLGYWAAQTSGFSGADLAGLVNEAAIEAARRISKDYRDGLAQEGYVEVGDREFAAARERVLLGARNHGHRLSEQERRYVAYHELGHALMRLMGQEAVEKVSILPRGRALGVTLTAPSDESVLHTPNVLRRELRFLMGGRAAEEVCEGTLTSGASDDMERASAMAREGLMRYGWGSSGPYVPKDESKRRDIENEAEEWVKQAYADAVQAMETHREALDRAAQLLMEQDEIDGTTLARILDIRLPEGKRDAIPALMMPRPPKAAASDASWVELPGAVSQTGE